MTLWITAFFITYFIVVDCFPNLEKIEVSKWKNGTNYCFISGEIDKVKCQHCELNKQNGGYRIRTQNKQLIKAHVPYDWKIIEVPFSLNCSSDEFNRDLENFVANSYTNSINIKMKSKARFFLVYSDSQNSCVVSQTKSVTEFEISDLHKNTQYEICISRLNKRGESGRYKCIQAMTAVTNTTPNANHILNGSRCENSAKLNNLEALFINHNLINVKWDIEVSKDCPIAELQVRLFEKHSICCEQSIFIESTDIHKSIIKTVKNQKIPCTKERKANVTRIKSAEIQEYWSKSSVYAQVTVVATDGSIVGKFSMDPKDGDVDLIKCYSDCYANSKYTGIRSADIDNTTCDKWSKSRDYFNYKIKSNWCTISDGSRPWCPQDYSSWQYCDIPECANYAPKSSECVSVVYRKYISHILSAKFVWNDFAIGYIILLHSQSGDCMKYWLYGIAQDELGIQVRNFFLSCDNGREYNRRKDKFVFPELTNGKTHTIYIIPIEDMNKVGKVTYYSAIPREITKKPSRVTSITVRSTSASSMIVSWRASEISAKHDNAHAYILNLTLNNKEIKTQRVLGISITFIELNQLTEYCVTVTAVNQAGSSEQSDKACKKTLNKDLMGAP